MMPTTIQIKKETRERLKQFGHKGESYDNIIENLMDYFHELSVPELIEERWERLQKEKDKYIPLDEIWMEIRVHPRVRKYLEEISDKEVLIAHLKLLGEDPYTPRKGIDIKKLKGKKHVLYRLRVGTHRLEYFIDDDIIWVEDAYPRGRGYR